jgi:hypothetical protein
MFTFIAHDVTRMEKKIPEVTIVDKILAWR